MYVFNKKFIPEPVGFSFSVSQIFFKIEVSDGFHGIFIHNNVDIGKYVLIFSCCQNF